MFSAATRNSRPAVKLVCAKHPDTQLQEQGVIDYGPEHVLGLVADLYCQECEAAVASLVEEVADARDGDT